MGLDVVCDGRLGFVNCTRQMLLNESFLLLPADKVVIEILENVLPDKEVVAACQRLRRPGYRIALDNFSREHPRERLVEFAECLKVDVRRFDEGQISDIIRRYRIATFRDISFSFPSECGRGRFPEIGPGTCGRCRRSRPWWSIWQKSKN